MSGDQASAWCREFEQHLTPQARARLQRDPDMTLLIARCITGGWNVEKLAELVGYKIGWDQPSNARAVMIFRLNRATGDEPNGD